MEEIDQSISILIGSRRVKDQEARSKKREERQKDRMERMEQKLDRMEDLVYRLMHRGNIVLSRQESGLTQYEGAQSDVEDATTPKANPYATEEPAGCSTA